MAQKYRMSIDAGAHYFREILYRDPEEKPIDLSGYTARMMLRHTYGDDEPVLSLTDDPNGGLAIDGPEGKINLVITAEQTELLCDDREVEGVYDLEIESGDGIVTRLIEGKWIARPEATK